jgi:CBS domain-containing protein
MDRGTAFVDVFNRLTVALAKMADLPPETPYHQLVAASSRKSAAVRRLADELRSYGNLRNAIVHGTEQVLAEPTEATLARFQALANEVMAPKRLESFALRGLQLFQPDASLVTALRYMREHDFSQVVVHTSEGAHLLTVEGVAQWLEMQVVNDIISVVEARVEDALKCESSGNSVVLSRRSSIYDVREAFLQALDTKHPRLFAVIVTESGRRTEKPLGIVTAWDVFRHA